MDFFDPTNAFERNQTFGVIGRLVQGDRTNQLLSSINQTLQQSLADGKNEQQQQRLIENAIYEMQKRLNRSRYQFERSPNEAFALLYETKETIDQSREQLQAVHSLEYKRLFEALEYDCSNLWDWAIKNVPHEMQKKYQDITKTENRIRDLKNKQEGVKRSGWWRLYAIAWIPLAFLNICIFAIFFLAKEIGPEPIRGGLSVILGAVSSTVLAFAPPSIILKIFDRRIKHLTESLEMLKKGLSSVI